MVMGEEVRGVIETERSQLKLIDASAVYLPGGSKGLCEVVGRVVNISV
ncbi:hypothetical protein ES702_03057 [subsurface metagenome]